jgi:hypothetical protein
VVAASDKKTEGVESNTDLAAYLIPTSMTISLVQKEVSTSCHGFVTSHSQRSSSCTECTLLSYIFCIPKLDSVASDNTHSFIEICFVPFHAQ